MKLKLIAVTILCIVWMNVCKQTVNQRETSVVLSKNKKFGLDSVIHVNPGESYDIHVKRKGSEKALMIITNPNDKTFYRYQDFYYLKDSAGWQTLHIPYHIPEFYTGNKLKVYMWGKGYDAEFKDLTIIKKKDNYLGFKSYLNLDIDSTEIEKIIDKRYQAVKRGILVQGNNDWVKAKLSWNGEKPVPAEIRLKGDWSDHLKGVKWSFRIKVKKNNTWQRLKEFSIQNPMTRSFIHEWVYHEFLRKEGILTTRYGFIPVYINGVCHGIYAYEEHFRKELLEFNKKKESPIFKYNEDGMWQAFLVKDIDYDCINFFEASETDVFKKKRIEEDPVLLNNYYIGKNIMQKLKTGHADLSQEIDLEAMAKYLAISVIFNAKHGMTWHNARFYYNPYSCKLEIIAYDGFVSRYVMNLPPKIHGFFPGKDTLDVSGHDYFIYQFFNNAEFTNLYIKYLEKYIEKGLIEDFLNDKKQQIHELEQLLQKEYIFYKYDFNFLKNAINKLNPLLQEYKKAIKTGRQTRFRIDQSPKEIDCNNIPPTRLNTIKAIRTHNSNYASKVNVYNYYNKEIEVIGSGNMDIQTELHKKIILKGYHNAPSSQQLIIKGNHNRIFYTTREFDSVFSEQIIDEEISLKNPRSELIAKALIKDPVYTINGNTIQFKQGYHKIKNPLVIPKGYQVLVNENTTLDLVNGALLYSMSPVNLKGKEGKEIRIISSDSNNQGIYIQTNSPSVLEHVNFEGLHPFTYKSWKLTGAVNFYNGKVELTNVTFTGNHSEDALNIINSEYTLYKCAFSKTTADAFDSDFSTGTISQCEFVDIGNDAIDCSGSKVEITDCKIINAGDKGISGGEESEISCNNITIENTYVCVASKDLSKVSISNSTFSKSVYGIVALVKKGEYGPSYIEANEISFKNISIKHLIEMNSLLMLENAIIKGESKKIADKFY